MALLECAALIPQASASWPVVFGQSKSAATTDIRTRLAATNPLTAADPAKHPTSRGSPRDDFQRML